MDHNDDVSSLRDERSRNRGRGAGLYGEFDNLSEAEEALDLPHSLGGAHGSSQQSSRNGGHSTMDRMIQHIVKRLKQSKISLIG